MAALLAAPPRTPSPKVRIRSQSFSFDSPSSIIRLNASTPIDDSPYSKSTGSINFAKTVPQHHVLLPLKTRMSDESMSDTSSAMSISPASSPTKSEYDMRLQDLPEGNLLAKRARLSPPRIELPPTDLPIESGPISPFAFQDAAFPMTSPWLVRVVLDLHDVHGLSWMDIGDAVGRVYGVQTGSSEVLGILEGNGRVRRMWWD
ncbi:hypothetical protein EJ07DRAFT_99940 [Lizonia empirigonia]|nr:hypothetical protein EJ07DRAFT_99940 [Lizonia empirigonia]